MKDCLAAMKKKTGSFLLALTLLLAVSVSACAAGDGFSDVAEDAPYREAVNWCRENGVMNGVSETEFDPDGTLTRSMLVTALYRAEGEPTVSGEPAFTDTKSGTWYSDAVVWAGETGLVQGYGNGLFGTNDPVSVEQLEVILGRYMGGSPEWTGDPAKAHAATRAQVASALYANLSGKDQVDDTADNDEQEVSMNKITITFGDHTYPATLEDNSSAEAFAELLESKGGSMTIHMSEYGGWEKVGSLGQTLPSEDTQTTTEAGDFVLYSDDQIVLFYGSNSWSYTRLGRIDDPSGLRDALGSGDVEITFALAK